jgi:hypothetical protein
MDPHTPFTVEVAVKATLASTGVVMAADTRKVKMSCPEPVIVVVPPVFKTVKYFEPVGVDWANGVNVAAIALVPIAAAISAAISPDWKTFIRTPPSRITLLC